jgi:hypothetical protein
MPRIQSLGLLDHDVLSSIEIPFLPDLTDTSASDVSSSSGTLAPPTQEQADAFDMETFRLPKPTRPGAITRDSYASSGSGTVMASSFADRRAGHRSSVISSSSMRTIGPIEESPRRTSFEVPRAGGEARPPLLRPDSGETVRLSTSPGQLSIHSVMSHRSTSTEATTREGSVRSSRLLKPLWFMNPFKNALSKPETVAVTASATTSPVERAGASAIPIPAGDVDIPTPRGSPLSRSPQALPSRGGSRGSLLSRTFEDESGGSRLRTSPLNTPPTRDDTFGRRRSIMSTGSGGSPSVDSWRTYLNPLREPGVPLAAQAALARRWEHLGPGPWYKHELKWRALVTPACLPLTVAGLPPTGELERGFGVHTYDFVADPAELVSFLVRPPPVVGGARDDARRAFAHALLRGMAAVRVAQGFQLVLRAPAPGSAGTSARVSPELHRADAFTDDDAPSLPRGAASVRGRDVVYLAMSNEIHRLAYAGDAIQVRRYVRALPAPSTFPYECLVWPKLGVGYTEMRTTFDCRGLEEYGWNRCVHATLTAAGVC